MEHFLSANGYFFSILPRDNDGDDDDEDEDKDEDEDDDNDDDYDDYDDDDVDEDEEAFFAACHKCARVQESCLFSMLHD